MRRSLTAPLPAPPSAPAAPKSSPSLYPVAPVQIGQPSATTKRKPVWLGIHLRGWQLHAALSSLADDKRAAFSAQPLAIVADDRRATIAACNDIAIGSGVRVGHSLNAAIALCARIHFLPRSEAHEAELLDQLATVCEAYTSIVHVAPPNELLLEVRGSFRLFGGLQGLLARLENDLKVRGHAPQLAVSATPQSAQWLSRAASSPIIVRPRELLAALAKFPVSALLWPADVELSLARFGVSSVGDLLRLPRAGLARRIGHARFRELDYAVGRFRQVRAAHRTRQTYEDRVILDFEIETTGLLSEVITRRFPRLARYLVQRNLATEQVTLELVHRDCTSNLQIGLAIATTDMAHVTKLMHEQLARLSLPAPVIEFVIRVERLKPAASVSKALFRIASETNLIVDAEPLARLLEQLHARLGEGAVRSISAYTDHRPEHAHVSSSARTHSQVHTPTVPENLATRPLWLLDTPHPMPAPRSAAKNLALDAAEIIEGGWFDEAPIDRTYFHLRSRRGARLWAYRENDEPARWFIHGLFG